MFLGYGRPIDQPAWKARDIALKEASRLTHQYAVGMTGSGKTAYLLSLIHQDIRAGNGFTVFDVEEALAPTVLAYLAEVDWPPDKLIVIDPTADRVVPFNVLKPIQHPHTAIEDVVAAMKRAWWDSWGDRMHDFLKQTLTALQEVNLTLGELTAFISHAGFRKKVLERVQNGAVKNYFEHHLGTLSPNQYRLIVESSRNKASQFTENPFIEPFISAEDCFDFQEAMDEGYAVIVSLPERLLKDSARLLGMLILSRLQGAALQRTHWTRPHFGYLDEFQNYASRSVIELLTRSRKRGLGLTVAHQNLQQPPFDRDPSFISTVLSNTNTQVFFQLGRDDAERLVKEAFGASGTEVKRQSDHWLWGPEGEPRFFSVQEEYEDYIKLLMQQEVRECIIRIRDQQTTYFATTFDRVDSDADPSGLVSASLAVHGVAKDVVAARRAERIAVYASRRRPLPVDS